MARTTWKRAERDAASILHGKRFPASSGGAVDVESSGYVAQVKNRRRFSLLQLEQAALEIERIGNQKQKIGIVMLRRSAGQGRETPWLICLTAGAWRELNGALPTEDSDASGA